LIGPGTEVMPDRPANTGRPSGDPSMRASYVRRFTDESGVSHFEDLDVEMVPGFAAPPAEPLCHAPFMTTAQCAWIGGTSDRNGDVPHLARHRFLLVNIRAEFQVAAGDGTVRDMVPGSVMLVEAPGAPGIQLVAPVVTRGCAGSSRCQTRQDSSPILSISQLAVR
jgi:hypothetical protein